MSRLSNFFGRLLGRRPAQHEYPMRWAAFAFDIPPDWKARRVNMVLGSSRAAYEGPAASLLSVSVEHTLHPDDPIPAPYADAWAAYDAIGEARFLAWLSRRDKTAAPILETRILAVRKATLAGHSSLYVDYEVGHPRPATVGYRLRVHYILHEQLWYSISRSSRLEDPHQQLEEMIDIMRSFRFTGEQAEAELPYWPA